MANILAQLLARRDDMLAKYAELVTARKFFEADDMWPEVQFVCRQAADALLAGHELAQAVG